MKRRIKALKKLQFEMIKIESTFYEEVHALECKYATKYTPLVEKVSFDKDWHLLHLKVTLV